MKRSRFQLILLIISILCLITLVGIQIGWVLVEAKREEIQFNQSVNLALNRIENNLEKYKNCTSPQRCGSCMLLTTTLKQVTNLDSIIKSDLNYYGIDLGYEYRIVDVNVEQPSRSGKGSYFTSNLSEKLEQNGFELKINFPSKRDFIIAQIGLPFITSIILVVLVTVSFLLIYIYYKREKLLSDQIRNFVNNMTHEFKTPLTNIGFANSMIAKNEIIESDPRLLSYTRIIRDEHHRLKDRIDELLKSSQSAIIVKATTEIVDLPKVIESVIDSFQARIEEKEGQISLDYSGNDLTIESNIDQLHIIFGNLIDNSIKYCSSSPRIVIYLKSSPDRILVEVTDNGIGIPAEHIKHIFEKFYRIPQGDTHDAKGFGLGLFHVKTLIEQMGGKIEVVSTIGKGTKFIINFPKHQIS